MVVSPESPSVRRDEESGEDEHETAGEEAYEVSGDRIRFDSTTSGSTRPQ